ncbi:MAG: Dam family site-specific DNA-(adenine-N6)-methyltransferase [Bifidobacteriaceae bacterium]|jgi:DNA adenine methylase|nr:Dam family site-specific DNA-(adenine-N6)-methyltransferase [Bifidobacteriaceae bacterium]
MKVVSVTQSKISSQSKTYNQTKKPIAKPFVKWAGGKRQLLTQINVHLPKNIDEIENYAEPFVGGGAVLFNLLQKYNFKNVYISDLNKGLIYTYQVIQQNVRILIEELSRIERVYLKLDTENKEKLFYNLRKEYNYLLLKNNKVSNNSKIRLSALFIALNKTCYNGLYRVNLKGEFNVPHGRYKSPVILDADNLYSVSTLLQNAEIHLDDYKEVKKFATKNTFIYFDPPYRPLTKSAAFTSYTSGQFSDEDQKELSLFVKLLSEKNINIMLSNSDPKNYDTKDAFFDEIYSWANIYTVFASRSINSNALKRYKISELLITNY